MLEAERDIAAWWGDYYAIEVMNRLGLPDGARIARLHQKAAPHRADGETGPPRVRQAVAQQDPQVGLQFERGEGRFGGRDRFRRRFQTVKQRLRDGQIGDVTSVVTRAFMNRMVPDATLRKTTERSNLTPMVVSGTHSLDMSMWLMEGKEPVEVYARSADRVLGEMGTKDATFGIFTMDDGTIFSMNINWALPTVWPGAVYGLEIGIVGTKGVIDIEDTHRDVILATEIPQPAGYASKGYQPDAQRYVDFIGSYPPGDVSDGLLWGPMREETMTWFHRLANGVSTPHATARDGHRNLILTMAMDRSARMGQAVRLPIDPEDPAMRARLYLMPRSKGISKKKSSSPSGCGS